MTYNHDGKLQSGSAAGVTVDLKYDPDGNRVYREVTSGPTTTKRKYVIDTEGDLPVVLLEINPDISDPNGCIVKTYLYACTDIIAQHDGCYADDKYFYLSDRIGSVRQVIDVNASVEHLYSYGPFGKRLESDSDPDPVTNRLGFTGQYFDEELDQYHLRARQYILALYRFSTRDPYTGSSNEPLELHRYLYCLNDPINSIDPLGEFSLGGISISTGIRASFQAWQGYDIAKRTSNFLTNLMEASDARQALMATAAYAVEMGSEYAGGKLFGAALKGLNRLGASVGANKLNHVFGKAAHHLGPLLSKFGGQKRAYAAVEKAFQEAVESGVYAGQDLGRGIVVQVGGELVVVRGAIVDGVAKIGTFFIP